MYSLIFSTRFECIFPKSHPETVQVLARYHPVTSKCPRTGARARETGKTTLETSGEDVNITLEASGEDVNITLETSGEDVNITLETGGEDVYSEIKLRKKSGR